MATLSDKDIEQFMHNGIIQIVPFERSQLGSASVDLTLSNEWWFFKKSYQSRIVDLDKTGFQKAMEKKRADSIMLLPGEMCLGKTIEKITLPANIIGRLEGRSRYARMGLSVHITSAVVQPGSSNHQVLEIVNFAPFPVTIHKGMRISQVIFHELKQGTSKPYAKYGKLAKKQ